MSETIIIGAGLAGLIAACRFKDATIYEAKVRAENHKALLRFRDKSVSELTGIPFKEVEVHKEISYRGESYYKCSISMANQYSRKVVGSYRGRSIWNLETVKRYIAPLDFYDQLADRHEREDRIFWNTALNKGFIEKGQNRKIINTAPLPVIMSVCGVPDQSFNFSKSTIHVDRYRLPQGTDVYQTIYFPQSDLRVFRASITGDVLIVESLVGLPQDHFNWPCSESEELIKVTKAFGLPFTDELTVLDSIDQKYGKIIDLPREEREAILYELTRDFNVFSLGRFATWRNLLLDDVVKDINVVERLMAASSYGRGLVLASRDFK